MKLLRLHLVCGQNEAGKSSALRALTALRHGIELRSTDNFVHEHARMSLGAWLLDRDGRPVQVVRRKGRGQTLSVCGADGEFTPASDDLVLQLTGGCPAPISSPCTGWTTSGCAKGGTLLEGGDESLHRQIADLTRDRHLRGAESRQLQAEQATRSTDWLARLHESGLPPLAPEALREWQARQRQVLCAAAGVATEAGLPAAEEQSRQHREALQQRDHVRDLLAQVSSQDESALRERGGSGRASLMPCRRRPRRSNVSGRKG